MYIPILISDIANLKIIPTDIYVFLPLNNKYLKFLKQGSAPSKLETLTSKNVDKVFVDYNDMRNFLMKRDEYGLSESKEVHLVAAKGDEISKKKIKEIINKQVDSDRPIDYSFLNYFIADFLNITVPNETSLLYYIITHLNLGKEVPHSQVVAILSILSALSKNVSLNILSTIGLAALYHEVPLVMRQDYNSYLDQYKPGTLSNESLDFYKNIPLCSDSIKIAVEYQNGEREELINKILFSADLIVHNGAYSAKEHILPLLSS